MATITFDNRDVQITSVFFQRGSSEHRFVSYPRRLNYGGREYVLAEQ